MPLQILCFLKWVICPFFCWIIRVLYSGNKSLIIYMIWKYILPFCGVFFFSLIWYSVFEALKFIILMMSNLFFFFPFCAFGVWVSHLRNSCLIQDYESLLLHFILRVVQFIVLYLDPWSIWVNLRVWCEAGGFIFLHVCIQSSNTICQKDCSFSLKLSWYLCQKSVEHRY